MLNIIEDKTFKINPVPSDIADDVLEQSVRQALSLTGISVETYDLQVCHRIRRSRYNEV